SMRRSCVLLASAAVAATRGGLLQHLQQSRGSTLKNARRALSEYVYHARMMDYYAQNDTAVCNEFPRARFILMLDRKALVSVDKETGETHLIEMDYEVLKNRLEEWGFELSLENSVFLDLQKAERRRTAEGVEEYEGVFGTALRSAATPPAGSPVSIDAIREEMASSFNGRFMDLRRAMLVMRDEQERNRLAKLQSLSSWSSSFRRCPSCGGALIRRQSKTAAECPSCRKHHYPTFSPVSITLIRDPADTHALLVRHRGSVPGVFTCVAGFAMTGETLSQCAKREVAEEVGIEASWIRQLDVSQPWPMPDSSLMIGHEAIANMNDKVQVCPDELEAARWFSRAEVAEALKRTEEDPHLKGLPRDANLRNDLLYVPPQGAIAHRLIKQWVEKDQTKRD
ncbi:hypothetical protein PENTCL1PPCAC_19169, partial [Pristionchus entomophagus]